MVDLAVVGGGYWGIAAAWLARAAGVDTVLLDDANPAGATRNSAGIFQRWWYRQDVAARRVPADWNWQGPSLDWLDELGLVEDTGEMFYSRAKPERRLRDDCLLVQPWRVEALIAPHPLHVERIEAAGASWAVVGSTGTFTARRVIVAAGAWTDVLLAASGLATVGVQSLRGRALVLAHPDPLALPVTYLARPYTHYTLRPWRPGQVRLGDTVERKTGDLSQLVAAAASITGVAPVVLDVPDGYRPVADRYVCDLAAPNLVVTTGGHRVGLGLAEPVARRALALLGVSASDV